MERERRDDKHSNEEERKVAAPVATPVQRRAGWTPAGVLSLQRSGAGNQAIARAFSKRSLARALRVTNHNWAPADLNGDDDDLDVEQFRNAMRRDNARMKALKPQEKARLSAIGNVHLEARDVSALTTLVISYLTGEDEGRARVLEHDRDWIADALGGATARQVSQDDERAFTDIIKEASLKSRAKGTASEIDLATLGGVNPQIKKGVGQLHATIAERNNELAVLDSYMGQWLQYGAGGVAGLGLSIRTAHMNKAGWLKEHAQPPLLDAAAAAWTGSANATSQVRARYRGGPVTAREIEKGDLNPKTKRMYYRDVWAPTLTSKRDRVRHAWREYAFEQLPGCPYIEFNGDQAGEISRIVYDYVDDALYIGLHYNWVKGYNPFFKVLGLPPTI